MSIAAYYSTRLLANIWVIIGVGLLALALIAVWVVTHPVPRIYDWQQEGDFDDESLTTGELTFIRKQQVSDASLVAMASLFRALDEPDGRERVRALFVEQAQERAARDQLGYSVHHPKDAA